MKKLITISVIFVVIAACDISERVEADYRNVIPLPHEIVMVAGNPFVIEKDTRILYLEDNILLERNTQFLAGYIKEATFRPSPAPRCRRYRHGRSGWRCCGRTHRSAWLGASSMKSIWRFAVIMPVCMRRWEHIFWNRRIMPQRPVSRSSGIWNMRFRTRDSLIARINSCWVTDISLPRY